MKHIYGIDPCDETAFILPSQPQSGQICSSEGATRTDGTPIEKGSMAECSWCGARLDILKTDGVGHMARGIW